MPTVVFICELCFIAYAFDAVYLTSKPERCDNCGGVNCFYEYHLVTNEGDLTDA